MGNELKAKNNRAFKHYLVLPKLQLKFIFLSAGTASLVGIAFFSIVYFFIKENYELLVTLSPMTDEVREQLENELNMLWFTMVMSFAVFTGLSCVGALIYSHKIAGPLYKMSKILNQFVEKPSSEERIHLRPNDELKELAATINTVLDLASPSSESKR